VLLMLACGQAVAARSSAPWVGYSLAGKPCLYSGSSHQYFDYRNAADLKNLPIVEHYHFTPAVENHSAGVSDSVAGDLHYTLTIFPNHHRALLSVIRYQLKWQQRLIPANQHLKTLPECYLQRAIAFNADDAMPLSLYGYYLNQIGKPKQAIDYYQQALTLQPDDAKIAYALGQLYLQQQQPSEALRYAEIAYRNGQPPLTLKQQLQALGVWPAP
jgi:tetratricopeptide (TPR) repeat protein